MMCWLYFYYILAQKNEEWYYWGVRMAIFSNQFYFLIHESYQFRLKGLSYFKDFWNTLQITVIGLNSAIIIVGAIDKASVAPSEDSAYLTILPSLSIFLMCV